MVVVIIKHQELVNFYLKEFLLGFCSLLNNSLFQLLIYHIY